MNPILPRKDRNRVGDLQSDNRQRPGNEIPLPLRKDRNDNETGFYFVPAAQPESFYSSPGENR